MGSDYKVMAHICAKDKKLYYLHCLHHIIVHLASEHRRCHDVCYHVLTFASDMRFRLVGLDQSRLEGNKIFNRMWKAVSHHY